jgi:FMN phosphatase YigB (HAD superfamily)
MSIKDLFLHQKTFNQQIWDPATQPLVERLKQLCLGMSEEITEFLKTYQYKAHRRIRHKHNLQNSAHSHEELIDMFKYWLSLADTANFPIDNLEQMYHDKSRVVQYRYQEEFVKEVDGPCVIVDIDNVLGDYTSAICDWAMTFGPELLGMQGGSQERNEWRQRLMELKSDGAWINSKTVGCSREHWQKVKHDFRTMGGKKTLNPFPDAGPFLRWCKGLGWTVILVTSRPIDQYPNIFTDTVAWLDQCQFPYDLIWWSSDKSERIEESSVKEHVVFAVDDSLKFVEQFCSVGIKTYYLNRTGRGYMYEDVGNLTNPLIVNSLTQIMERETEWQILQTRSIDPTASTPARSRAIQSPTDRNP